MNHSLRMFFQKFEWPSAIMEVFLIFLGITLAIWFDDWKEARQDRETEIAILNDLRAALATDMRDLRVNLGADMKTEISCGIILDHLENRRRYHDSLDYHFGRITYMVGFMRNLAVYENLKKVGFYIISSEEMRYKIMEYYELQVPWLTGMEEELIIPYNRDIVDRQMFENLSYSAYFEPARPLNYRMLFDNAQFQNAVRGKRRLTNWKIRRMQGLMEKAQELEAALVEELEKLG